MSRLAIIAGLLVLGSAAAGAQAFAPTLTTGGIYGTTRDERWSPLLEPPSAGRGVVVPRTSTEPALLDRTRVGLFWTAGVAAALPFEFPAPRAALAVGRHQSSGDLRRPLDPVEVSATSVAGLAWQPIGASGFGLGRASLDLATVTGTLAVLSEPYAGSPFVLTDTLAPEMNRPRATIEGVAAWRVGNFGFGGSAGMAAADTRSSEARNARTGRVGIPAGTASIAYAFGGGRVIAAAYGRVRSYRETGHSFPVSVPGRIYRLEGYSEPEAIEIGINPYYRRIESTYAALGVSAGGSVVGARWTLFAEQPRIGEKQRTEQRRDAPLDRWEADGIAWGAAAQRSFADSAFLITGDVRYESMDGHATRPDLQGFIFVSEDRALVSAVELRHIRASGLEAAIRFRLGKSTRSQLDALAEFEAEYDAWTTSFGGEVGWNVGSSIRATVGYAGTVYTPAAIIPADSGLGTVQRTLIMPELEFAARQILSHDLRGVLSWNRSPGTSHWFSFGYGRRNTRDDFFASRSRSIVSIALGMTLR